MGKKTGLFERYSYGRHPWTTFLLVFLFNVLLSYFRPSGAWPALFLALGLAAVGLSAFLQPGGDRGGGFLLNREVLPLAPSWVGALLVPVFGFLLFYYPPGLGSWPRPDEGMTSICAMALSKKWDWRFYYHFSQNLPLYYWIMAVYYRIFPPSLESLRLFPSLASALVLALNFLAARRVFSGSFAAVSTVLLGFNFWFLYSSHLNMGLVLYPLLLWGGIWIMALVLKPGSRARPAQMTALGAYVALGFFSSVTWILSALALGGIVGAALRKKNQGNLFPYFLFPSLLGFFFIVGAEIHGGFGKHVEDLMSPLPGGDWRERASNAFSYLVIPFWGAPRTFDYYGPFWGGLFNPVEDSLFFIGLVEWRSWGKSGPLGWLPLVLMMAFLPGLPTRGLEMFRIHMLLPVVLFVATAGFLALLSKTPPGGRRAALFLLTALSAGLSLQHFYGSFFNFGKYPDFRSAAPWQAYQVLSAQNNRYGPGAVLSEFRLETLDQTLEIACYPFDAGRNPRFSGVDPRWVAVRTNPNYRPFLSRRFPEGQWFPLAQGGGDSALWVVPVRPDNRDSLVHWMEVDRKLQDFSVQILMDCDLTTGLMPHPKMESLLKSMALLQGDLQGDPFLESCFYEKVSVYFEMDQDPTDAQKAVESAIRLGYPAANLFNHEGVLWAARGNYGEAAKAFRKALDCPVNDTPARQNLEKLGAAAD